MKKMKRTAIRSISCLLAVLLVSTGLLSFAAYGGEVTPKDNGYYVYEIESTSEMGVTYTSSKELIAISSPATRDGETFTASVSRELSVGISGNLQVGEGTVSAALGFDISETYSFSAQSTSAQLSIGEYVKAYARNQSVKYKVVQAKYYVLHGDRALESRETIYVYKPIMPEISFVYCR